MKFKIKQILEEKEISQRKLAGLTGISKSTIGRIINQEQEPSLDALLMIADALDLKMDDLIDRA